MTEWYYGRNSQNKGPVSQERLEDLVASGRIMPTDLAWYEGLAEWTPIQDLPELSAAVAQASAEVWYYGQGENQQGPISVLKLRSLISSRHVGADWLAWKDGMAEWLPIAEIPGLAGGKASPPKSASGSPTSSTPAEVPSRLGGANLASGLQSVGVTGLQAVRAFGVRSLLLGVGSAMMFIAFFTPWWGLTVTIPAPPERPESMTDRNASEDYRKEMEDYTRDQEKFRKQFKKDEDWYDDAFGDAKDDFKDEMFDAYQEQMSEGGGDFSLTIRLWGWSTGVGLTNFIFSIFLLPIAIAPLFFAPLRNWVWVGCLLAAVLALIGNILAIVWYFGSPSENVAELLAQGVGLSPGPYLQIAGTLMVLGGSVVGLLERIKSTRPVAVTPTNFAE